jgi:hypothetical protein
MMPPIMDTESFDPAFRHAVRWADVSGLPPVCLVSAKGLPRRFRNTIPASGRSRAVQIDSRAAWTIGRIPTRRDFLDFVLDPSRRPSFSTMIARRCQSMCRQSSRKASCVLSPVSHSTIITGAAHWLYAASNRASCMGVR